MPAARVPLNVITSNGSVAPAGVSVDGLAKRYGNLNAVDGLTFDVARGEIFAFLGPNGAGKSTTIKMLCTLARPTGGRASVAGFDVVHQSRSVRQKIGLVFQDQTLDEQLTAEENLRLHAVLYRIPSDQVADRIDRALEVVELSERRRDRVEMFSGGMARRLEIARAFLHNPEVLFLDEPTVGLDPQTRARIWANLLRLREEQGMTIFFTTHYMDEAEYADRIAIIDHGKIVALDTPANLKATAGTDTVYLTTQDDRAALLALQQAGFAVREGAMELITEVDDAGMAVPSLIAAASVPVHGIRIQRPTLDDVFIHFTGHAIRSETPDGFSRFRRIVTARRR